MKKKNSSIKRRKSAHNRATKRSERAKKTNSLKSTRRKCFLEAKQGEINRKLAERAEFLKQNPHFVGKI